MRADAIGLFWQDLPRKGTRMARVMPPIPDTGWTAPTEFPNLSAAKALAVDCETYDPELNEHGPGWARGVGHIVGIAVGVPEGQRWYFPMRHEIEPEHNLDPETVLKWARDTLTNKEQPKIGANITYDVGWLRQENVKVRGRLHDVQFAEALLRERAKVNLDALFKRYGFSGKKQNLLDEWLDAYYGGPKTKLHSNIYRSPPRLAGPYAEGDVDLFKLLDKQWPELNRQGLMDVYDLECKLIYLMIEMRFKGVNLDLDRAEQLRDLYAKEIVTVDKQLAELVGFPVNPNSGSEMLDAFEKLGLTPGITEKGKKCKGCDKCPHYSFAKPVLKAINHPFVDLIQKKRAREKFKNTFIEGYLLNSHIDGILYGSFHQLRGDNEGTRSGRFSSSDPNLQNIPFRSKVGKAIREAFIPSPGHLRWIKLDYSQIEYRELAHFAVGPGAQEVRDQYLTDAATDFHKLVQSIIFSLTGLLGSPDDRPLVKNVNFGTVYGMGINTMAEYLKLSKAEAKKLLEAIHSAAPFMKATMDATMDEASKLGYITTILGRRSRFDLWVPQRYTEDAIPLPYDDAILRYGNIERAGLHKALNRRLQGSAADLIKTAMLKCWEDGLFDEDTGVGVPRLTVHDELDFSDPGGKDDVFREVIHTMETAIPFKVPIKVDAEAGPSWGAVKDITI